MSNVSPSQRPHSALKRAFGWAVFVCVGLLFGGCPPAETIKKQEVIAPKSQLYKRARLFNGLLRWKAYQRAKPYVSTKHRASFMLKWEGQRGKMRITGYSIRDVTFEGEGKRAVVLVSQQRYTLPSVTVKSVLLQQLWESKEGIWFYKGEKKKTPTKVSPTPSKTTSSSKTAPPKIRTAKP